MHSLKTHFELAHIGSTAHIVVYELMWPLH